MNRKIPYDRTLILLILALLGIGLVMVFSASSVISKEIYGSSTRIFVRQLIAAGLGLGLLLVVMRIDYRIYARPLVLTALLLGTVGLLVWALFSPDVNGVNRWVRLGGFRLQPSEAAKIVVVFLTAYFLSREGGRKESFDFNLALFGLTIAVVTGLVLWGPDFGTATTLGVITALLLFLGGLRYRYYLLGAILAAPALYFLVLQVPYRRQRLFAFWEPEADPFGAGYQILQSLVAVGSGGLGGKGLAQGTQKLFFLPEPHTDFIYAVIAEETGLMGCSLILLLFLAFMWRGTQIALRADTIFGTYVGLGIVGMIVFQALFNISVVLSLCPTKGIPLPFISVGGSSMVVMLISVGVLLNISKHSRSQIAAAAPSLDLDSLDTPFTFETNEG